MVHEICAVRVFFTSFFGPVFTGLAGCVCVCVCVLNTQLICYTPVTVYRGVAGNGSHIVFGFTPLGCRLVFILLLTQAIGLMTYVKLSSFYYIVFFKVKEGIWGKGKGGGGGGGGFYEDFSVLVSAYSRLNRFMMVAR